MIAKRSASTTTLIIVCAASPSVCGFDVDLRDEANQLVKIVALTVKSHIFTQNVSTELSSA